MRHWIHGKRGGGDCGGRETVDIELERQMEVHRAV